MKTLTQHQHVGLIQNFRILKAKGQTKIEENGN